MRQQPHDPTARARLEGIVALQRSIDGRVRHRRNVPADSKSVWFTRAATNARRRAR